MSMGEIKFKQKGRDDQAEPDDMSFPNKVGELMGVNADEMMKAFCKPKIKVGTEWVTKGQTCEQVIFYYKIIFVPIYLSVVGIISL
jgi:myosin heavy subunit